MKIKSKLRAGSVDTPGNGGAARCSGDPYGGWNGGGSWYFG
jgi:hypothetical protein